MVASEMEKRGKEAVVGGGLHLLAIPHGDNGGGALSGEQRPEKVLQGSWQEVVRERGGVGGFCEGEERQRRAFYSRVGSDGWWPWPMAGRGVRWRWPMEAYLLTLGRCWVMT
jgi:hypothetical protein